MKKTLRPPIKRHGGKFYLAAKIIPLLPPHRSYVEPFAGGLSVLLNKPRSEEEAAGDLDWPLVNFLRVLRDNTDSLCGYLERIPYCRAQFDWACEEGPNNDGPLEQAARFVVRNRFSRGGLGTAFAWSDRLRGGRPGDENAWLTILADLPRIASRLDGVQIHHTDALHLIADNDGPDTLFYLDPPYVHATRTAKNAYEHEMDDAAHRRLLELAVGLKGMVAISGYRCDLYDEALEGWHRAEFEMPNHSGQTKAKGRRVEALWLNPNAVSANSGHENSLLFDNLEAQ